MYLHFFDILAMRYGIIVNALKPILMYGDSYETEVSKEIILCQRYDDMFPKFTEKSVLILILKKYVVDFFVHLGTALFVILADAVKFIHVVGSVDGENSCWFFGLEGFRVE